MKIYAFLLFIPFICIGQKQHSKLKKIPFQVIYSSEMWIDGKIPLPLEYVEKKSTIELAENGIALLLHSSHEIIELRNKHFATASALEKTYLKGSLKQNYRIDPSRLFETTGRYPAGHFHPEIHVIYPANPGITDLCGKEVLELEWIGYASENTPYIVRVIDVFDVVLDSIPVLGNVLNLNFSKYNEKIVLVEIYDPENDQKTSLMVVRKGDQYCSSGFSSYEYLIKGLREENIGAFKNAEVFYKKALENADLVMKEFYENMVSNFDKRKVGYLKFFETTDK